MADRPRDRAEPKETPGPWPEETTNIQVSARARASGSSVPSPATEIVCVDPVCDRGTLTVVSGSEAGAIYRLGARTVVGRADDCEIRIQDAGVSRRHAIVVQESATEYFIRDLGSSNGITVRGRRVQASRIADGDRIGVGPVFFRFALADESEENALKQRYESSILDGLTGAMNRKHFDDRLLAELSHADRTGIDVSLVLFDVDHFKRINDTFGHPAGDEVLKRLASLLTRTLRLQDILARYGGEEFAIIARGISPSSALALGERVRNLVATTPFQCDTAPFVPVTVSVGIASVSECAEGNVTELIALADARLYAAKAAGRNCCRGA
jgi:diguanylate cyclase (GGDEF)-like protein